MPGTIEIDILANKSDIFPEHIVVQNKNWQSQYFLEIFWQEKYRITCRSFFMAPNSYLIIREDFPEEMMWSKAVI